MNINAASVVIVLRVLRHTSRMTYGLNNQSSIC